MDAEKLKEILENHKKWLNGDGGERANLCWANLREADLYGADLRGADLRGANLPYGWTADTIRSLEGIS